MVALPDDPRRAEAVLRALREQNASLRAELADLRAGIAEQGSAPPGHSAGSAAASTQRVEPMPLNAADWDEEATIHQYVAPSELAWNLPKHREWQRTIVSVGLLFALLFIIIASFVTLWIGDGSDTTLKDLLQIVYAPLLGIVGAAIGFYFGQRPNAQD